MDTPAKIIESLLSAGLDVRSAWAKSGHNWKTFIRTSEFKALQETVAKTLDEVGKDELERCLVAIRQRQQELCRGRDLSELPAEELTECRALSDTEHQLVIRLLKTPRSRFLEVLTRDLLPYLAPALELAVKLLR